MAFGVIERMYVQLGSNVQRGLPRGERVIANGDGRGRGWAKGLGLYNIRDDYKPATPCNTKTWIRRIQERARACDGGILRQRGDCGVAGGTLRVSSVVLVIPNLNLKSSHDSRFQLRLKLPRSGMPAARLSSRINGSSTYHVVMELTTFLQRM